MDFPVKLWCLKGLFDCNYWILKSSSKTSHVRSWVPSVAVRYRNRTLSTKKDIGLVIMSVKAGRTNGEIKQVHKIIKLYFMLINQRSIIIALVNSKELT